MATLTAKKWHEWYSNLGSPATMAGMLTTEPLGHLVTAADQAYLIVTDVAKYCSGCSGAAPAALDAPFFD